MFEPLTELWPFGPTAAVVVGALLVLAGRRLFWLAVGTIGFLAGFGLAGGWAADPGTAALVVGILAGLLGALLAVVLQRLAVGLAGFVVGGFVAVALAGALGWELGGFAWLVFLAGAISSAILAGYLFDLALVLVTSVTGAALVTDALAPPGLATVAAFLLLTALGVFVQSSAGRRRPAAEPARRPRRRVRDSALARRLGASLRARQG